MSCAEINWFACCVSLGMGVGLGMFITGIMRGK